MTSHKKDILENIHKNPTIFGVFSTIPPFVT